MSQLKIPCPHCNRTISVDETKLPDRAVTFACPLCKGKVTADKTKLQPSGRPTITRAALPPSLGGEGADASANAGAPAEAAEIASPLPPGASLPPGLIVGDDGSLIASIRRALDPLGAKLDLPGNIEEARTIALADPPPLAIFVAAGPVGAPPFEPIGPLASIPPRERRQMFLVLIADGIRTLDGNAAFMYGVNLCVNKRDIAELGATIYGALEHHNRMYRAFFQALEGSD